MNLLGRAPRVRLHYFDQNVPSVEGLLVGRRHREYVIAIPELLMDESEEGRVKLASRRLLVPREAISMLEVRS